MARASERFTIKAPRTKVRGVALRGRNLFEKGDPFSPGPIARVLSKRSRALAAVIGAGGVLVDHGWLRLFGAGEGVPDLETWNENSEVDIDGEPAYYVAADVIGGFFLLAATGIVYYVRPDTARMEAAARSYDDLLGWALRGDMDALYGRYRFRGWVQACCAIRPEWSFISKPPLWKKGGLAAFKKARVVASAHPELRNLVIDAVEAETSRRAKRGSRSRRR